MEAHDIHYFLLALAAAATGLALTQLRYERGAARGRSWIAFTSGTFLFAVAYGAHFAGADEFTEGVIQAVAFCGFATGFVIFSSETRKILLLEAEQRVDPLTRLPNKRAFEERVEQEFARAKRLDRKFAVCVVDIDQIDMFDADEQERGFLELADVIRKFCRESDFAAKIGGTHFGFLLVDTDDEGGLIAVERVAQCFRQAQVDMFAATARALDMTLSAGVAGNGPDVTRPAEILRFAEVALYQARRAHLDSRKIFDRADCDEELTRLVTSI